MKRIVTTLAKLLFVVLVPLIAVEAFTRVHIYGMDGLSYTKMKSSVYLGETDFVLHDFPNCMWRLKPDINGIFKTKPFRTNSHGLRDKEYDMKKPAGTFRIALLGDSLTMPAGVAIEDAYHSLLEERLTKKFNRPVEIINFSVGGYNFPHYLTVLEEDVPAFEPDMVFVAWSLDGDVTASLNCPKEGELPQRNGFFTLYILDYLPAWFNQKKEAPEDNFPDPRNINEMELFEYFLPQWEITLRGIEKLQELSREGDLPILHIIMPQLNFIAFFEPTKKILLEQFDKKGINYIDLDALFDKTVKGREMTELWINLRDSHPNKEAHRTYADILYEQITRNPLFLEKIKETR